MLAKGLCQRHYRRERAGQPLTHESERKGEPDGYGQYGMLDENADGVLCHECGCRSHALGNHVSVHDMTAREYKLAHGLPVSKSLSSARRREQLSHASRQRMHTEAWTRFEENRDPIKASLSRDPDMLKRGKRVQEYDESQPEHLQAIDEAEPWAERHEKWRVMVDEQHYPVAYVAHLDDVHINAIYEGVRAARERIGDTRTDFPRTRTSRPLTAQEKKKLDKADHPHAWGDAALKILESDNFVRVSGLAEHSHLNPTTASVRIHHARKRREQRQK